MTLLVARQCRLLRAPHGAIGPLQRLQRPWITVARRCYASRERDASPEKKELEQPLSELEQPRSKPIQQRNPSNKRLDLSDHKQRQGKLSSSAANKQVKRYQRLEKSFFELSRLLTPDIQDSEIVPVNSAIIIPASVTAAVS